MALGTADGVCGSDSKSRTGDNAMSDDLTNQIALLCDIGELHLPKAYRRSELEQLISGSYVGRTESHARSAFMLTAKGVEFLGKRGAGLNEGVDLPLRKRTGR